MLGTALNPSSYKWLLLYWPLLVGIQFSIEGMLGLILTAATNIDRKFHENRITGNSLNVTQWTTLIQRYFWGA